MTVMLALVSALAFTVNAYDNLKLVERIVEDGLRSTEEVTCDVYWTGVGYPVVSRDIPSKELTREGYKTSYNSKTLNPNWVAWCLTAEHLEGKHSRSGYGYTEDADVSPRQTYDDWRRASAMGFDHGHMCPAADNKWSEKAMAHTFLLTNMCPQNSRLNKETWERLERSCRKWASRLGRIYIVCGPIYRSPSTKKMGRVTVPDAFYKLILYNGDKPRAIGFVYNNCDPADKDNMQNHVVAISEIEKMTGITFFPQLKSDMARRLKSVTNFNDWNRF